MSNKNNLQTQTNQYLSEYIQCKSDFYYYCTHYVYLELAGGDVLFNPYAKQKEFIDLVLKEKHVLTLKSRQLGLSTTLQAFCSWLAVFYDNVVIGIISKDGKESTDFARTVRGMIEKLPNWMKPPKGIQGRGFSKHTEQSFILTNGSKVYASPVNPNAPEKTLRGKAISLLIIDEAAFIQYLDEAWTSMVPALSTAQKQARNHGIPYGTIVVSTPNKTTGKGKWYFNKYSKAISNEGMFKPFIIHWKMVPELASDPTWYKTQCELFDNDPRKIQQELEMKFLPTEGSFFSAETVEKMQNAVKPPIEKLKLFNGEAWVWEHAIPGVHYLIGVDTASEFGNDKSAITVWNYQTLEQVWEYKGKLKVTDFLKVVKVACGMYRNATLVIESTGGYGNQIVEGINEDPSYMLMLYKEKRGIDTIVPGLSNNSKTRPLMIDALYSYFTEFPEVVRSERLALELSGLVSKKNGRVEAEDTELNDDLALGTACAFYVRKYDSGRLLIDLERNIEHSAMMNQIMQLNDTSTKMDNASIMSKVKNDIKNHEGLVDILSLYNNC